MLSLLSDIDPLWGSLVGLAIGVFYYWKGKHTDDPKYKEAQIRAQTAVDSLQRWAEKHQLEHQRDMLQLDFRRKPSKKGHHIFILDVDDVLNDVLKELLCRLKVEYTPKDMEKMIENLQPFFTGLEEKILKENMVVDMSHNIPDFCRKVSAIFRLFLVQTISDYMEDQVKNVHNNSRKVLTRRLSELMELMIQHEVYIDIMARDEWVLNGSRNMQEQVYKTPEERQGIYERMRKAWKKKMKNILGNLKKILGKIKLAYQNDLEVYYYWA